MADAAPEPESAKDEAGPERAPEDEAARRG